MRGSTPTTSPASSSSADRVTPVPAVALFAVTATAYDALRRVEPAAGSLAAAASAGSASGRNKKLLVTVPFPHAAAAT